jgi:hypothetical protein
VSAADASTDAAASAGELEQEQQKEQAGGKLCARAMVQLGRQCKELLDAGRAAFVRDELQLHPHALLYCSEHTSAENHLLLASHCPERSHSESTVATC